MLAHWRAGFNPRADTPEVLSADDLEVLSLNEQQLAKYENSMEVVKDLKRLP